MNIWSDDIIQRFISQVCGELNTEFLSRQVFAVYGFSHDLPTLFPLKITLVFCVIQLPFCKSLWCLFIAAIFILNTVPQKIKSYANCSSLDKITSELQY